MNTLEDRLTKAGDELRHAADRMPAMQVPKSRPLLSALAFAAGIAAVLLLVAIPAWLLGGGGSDDGVVVDTTVEGRAGAGDVFMLPGFVPEGFTFSLGQLLDATMRGTASSSKAAGTYLQYLQGEATSVRPGEPNLTIEVTDLLAVFGTALEGDELECYDGDAERIASSEACRKHLAGSTCVGEEAIEAGELDAEACIAEERESVAEAYGDDAVVEFVETTVRGRPAHITTVESPQPGFISVTTYEGGPVVSVVTGYLVDQATLLRVANELRAVDPDDFDEVTSSAREDVGAPRPKVDDPTGDASDTRAEAEHWYRLEEALRDAAVGLVGGAIEPDRITVYVHDPDGAEDVIAAAGVPAELEVVVEEVAEAGPQPARWQVDPDETLDEDTTAVRVLVEEMSCASGRSAQGRILEPEIGYTPDQIFISIRVQPLPGSQDCPGNPLTPYVIYLDEPLGERELVDANDEW